MIGSSRKEVGDMMTIKAFAKLCGCTAQTLRYYDSIGLLKPMRVDDWTGYRYYDKAQAIDFVKIRNLQAADFSIREIEALLSQPEEAVFDAFEEKIAAQQEKLRRIREIQQTYLREKNAMEN
jgi:DNA-binding transcriptional MerR regulator